MFCTFWSLHRTCETVCEDLAVARCVITAKRLKNYVVTALRIRCPVPRSMKRDKEPVAVTRGELILVVARHRVRCPMSRKGRCRRGLAGTNADVFATIASIFRCEHQFFLERIVIALGPAIVATGLQQHHFLRGQGRFVILLEEIWPI